MRSIRDPITVGSADSWFWAFALLTLAPTFLSEFGLVQSTVAWLTEAAPSVELSSSSLSVGPATIVPASTGHVPGTSTWFYILLAALLLSTGSCQFLLKLIPRLAISCVAAVSGWIFYQGGEWYLPVAGIPIVILALKLQGKIRQPSTQEDLRSLAVLLGLWALSSPLPYVGITMIALGGFGVIKPSRLSPSSPLVVAAAAFMASTLMEGENTPSMSRYLLYGIFAFGVIYQFGRYGILKSAGPLLAALILALCSIINSDSPIADSLAQIAGIARPVPLSSGSLNWLELIIIIALVLNARWFGVILEQNAGVIRELKSSKRTPRHLIRALKASAPMLGLAAALWAIWFTAASYVQRASIHEYVSHIGSISAACPDRVIYTATPEPSDYLTVVRLAIERDKSEMHRCFEYKVNEGVHASQRSVAEVAEIAKTTFAELWPDRLPGTATEKCGHFDVICLLKNGVKSIVNRKYQKLKGAAIGKFVQQTDAEASRLIAAGGATGETMKSAVLSKLDEQAAQRHALAIDATRISRILGIAITVYLLFLAIKLYLSVLARFVFHSRHRSIIPVTSFGKGAVTYEVVPLTKDGRVIDVKGWQFSKSLTIANCVFRACPPYQPTFAIIRRLRKWYLTNSAHSISADPPCLIEPPLDVILKITLERNSAVLFDPKDLIGFRENVKFVAEWNFRLISLVFCRHRFWIARGPGEILLRLPYGATSDETSSGVHTIKAHSADEDYGVSGSVRVWDVAATPETILFSGNNTTWIASQSKWKARIRSLRAFLLPV